jgi:Sortase domain
VVGADARLRHGAVLLLAVAVAVGLTAGLAVALHGPPAPVAPAVAAGPAAPVPSTPAAAPVHATTLDVPALGIVRATLVPLGVDAAGALVPPGSPGVPGWYTGSAAPGDVGPTVIAGHVDSRNGPGVFFRLGDLRPGDTVAVGRSDGATAHFRVTDVVTVPKTAFPTDTVYGPTPGPELRLITCGGAFDHAAGSYLRDVVVSGVLDGRAGSGAPGYPGFP